MKFYLGSDVHWLGRLDVPLFVSARRLRRYKTTPRASGPWAMDSGGFTELSLFGKWETTAEQYATTAREIVASTGSPDFIAPMDAMCEPWILDKCREWLGGTVDAHQAWTVENFLELTELAPDLPIIPVIQGWEIDDYPRCINRYARAGIDLTTYSTVGLGSVCRRQGTDEIAYLVRMLSGAGIRLHGFGMKAGAIAKIGHLLSSADSMAWSYSGRKVRPCPRRPVASCAHCLHHAMEWRERVLTTTIRPQLFDVEVIS